MTAKFRDSQKTNSIWHQFWCKFDSDLFFLLLQLGGDFCTKLLMTATITSSKMRPFSESFHCFHFLQFCAPMNHLINNTKSGYRSKNIHGYNIRSFQYCFRNYNLRLEKGFRNRLDEIGACVRRAATTRRSPVRVHPPTFQWSSEFVPLYQLQTRQCF